MSTWLFLYSSNNSHADGYVEALGPEVEEGGPDLRGDVIRHRHDKLLAVVSGERNSQ